MNALVASSITAAIMLVATGPDDDINIVLCPKGVGIVDVVGSLNASGSGRFELGLDVPGGTLTFTGVGVNADSPVADDDYVITPWTIITTRNGVITAITPP